jgi:hypothetical protein
MRDAEQSREVAKDGTRFGCGGHRHIVLNHLHRTLDEDVKKTGAATLREERFALGKVLHRMIAERGKD